ncbi:MAG: DoxX family protein [Acidobacteriota bacterium]|nr:MAG: DoxX family protein [Acidobacteriota bacterium]
MAVKRSLFDSGRDGAWRDLGLLLLRLGFAGSMLLNHGWGKLVNFGNLSAKFPDPLGVGSAASLVLAIFGEVICAVAVVFGFLGRWAAIPMAITMAVAFFIVHAADPFREKELALVYLLAFVALALAGPGRFSLDRLIGRR